MQKRALRPRLVQNVAERVRLYIRSNPSLELFRMCRLVRIVVEQEKSFVKNVRIVVEQDIFPARKRYLLLFRQVLIMVRVFAFVIRVSLEQMADQEEICW